MPLADSFIIGSNVFPLSLLNLITGSAAPLIFPKTDGYKKAFAEIRKSSLKYATRKQKKEAIRWLSI
jgi:hypothetical protein